MKGLSRRLPGGLAIVAMMLMAMLVLPMSLSAQTTYGSVVGTVTDASGAVVPSANVTITNTGTNEKRTAQSGAAGEYQVVNLAPASYKIEIDKAGFKRAVRSSVTIQVGATVRVDAALQVGSATETVQVTSAAPLLQTDSGSVSNQIEGQTVQEMPVNGRNPVNLIALAANVVPQGGSMGTPVLNQNSDHSNQAGWNNFQVGGSIAGQSGQYIDGVPNNVLAENDSALLPTQDAIQEFSVATNNVSADFGRFAGGVVNMTTKSGTNKWHGSAYDYVRNTVFNANDWFSNHTGLPRAPWTQNQFGVVANGPILHDKAFFLFTWEGFRADTSNTLTNQQVASADMLAGYIPAVAGWDLNAKNIASGAKACNITATTAPGGEDAWYIPDTCWDESTKEQLKYFVAPNAVPGYTNPNGLPNSGSGDAQYNAIAPLVDRQNQYNGRIDYNLSSKQRLFGRYTYWQVTDSSSCMFCSNTVYDTGNPAATWRTHQFVLGDTYTLNANNIVDVRIGWTRQKLFNAMPSYDLTKFGGNFAVLSKLMSVNITPIPSFGAGPGGGGVPTDGINIGARFHWPGPNEQYQNNYSLNANLVRIMGRHSLKAGAEIRLENEEALGNSNSTDFSYAGAYTGDAFADFLLGYPSKTDMLVGAWTTGYNYYQGYYVQDNWTAAKNLTLNLGLRWELPGAIGESHGKNTVLLPDATDPITHVKGTMALVNSSLWPSKWNRNLAYNLFAPRVGFAYRLAANTSVHGGYGIAWVPIDVNQGLMPAESPINEADPSSTNPSSLAGLSECTSYYARPGSNGAPLCYYPSSQGFGTTPNPILPSGRTNFDDDANGTMANYVATGSAISGPVPTDAYGYNQQWNLAVSRQLKGNLLVELSYMGAKGTHLPGNDGGGLNETTSQSKIADVEAGAITAQSSRPFPEYNNVSDLIPMWGSTTYHAGTVKVEKRFQSGGLISANYTWAKMIGNTDTFLQKLELSASGGPGSSGAGAPQDSVNHAAERSLLSYNTPNRLVASYILPLPFGKGQKYGSNLGGLANGIVGGWSLDGISSFQSGFPLFIFWGQGNQMTRNLGYAGLRPNYTAACPKTKSGSSRNRLDEWFNTECFTYPGDYALGNEPRVDSKLSSQGVDNTDLSLSKNTKIWEKASVEFRAEFFNAFNRTQFAPPALDASNPTSPHGPGFGAVTASNGHDPRKMQLSLRLKF